MSVQIATSESNLENISSDEEKCEEVTEKSLTAAVTIPGAGDEVKNIDDNDGGEVEDNGNNETEEAETERQLLAVDDDEEEGEVVEEDFERTGIGLLGSLEDDVDEIENALNPLDADEQEEGEIVEDEAETQALNLQDETADKTIDPFSEEQEQSFNRMDVDLDTDAGVEDEGEDTQNPLGTTVEADESESVTCIEEGVERLSTTAENEETQRINDDEISEVNPADFLLAKDDDTSKDGNSDKEEGEIDDVENENDVSVTVVIDDEGKDDTPTSEKEMADGDVNVDGGGDAIQKDGENKDDDGENKEDDDGENKEDGDGENKGDDDVENKEDDDGENKGDDDGENKDDDGENKEDDDGEKKDSDDEEGSMPMIRMNSNIFESQPDDEEDDDEDQMGMNDSSMDPELIQNMMEFEMDEGESDGSNILQGILKKKSRPNEVEPIRRILPRRAAAQAAANTIKKISNLEQEDPPENDPEYVSNSDTSRAHGTSTFTSSSSSATGDGDRHRCHHCKKMGSSLIVVRQYGTDIHLCSNSCFNSFRNPDPTKRPLPCAKCGILNRDTENATVMYWETMNFCSDLCVGNFQLEIGSKCSTCVKRVAWQSLGKYCVRFGSDIRQFCSALCLESYKKNARVCFHCQLDIKRLGNVVMANIPMKATPKEFCGQDCVEMYIEQNLQQPRPKQSLIITCCICSLMKPLDKELVISPSIYQICGEKCWQQLLESQSIKKATKCETCTKFINMEYIKPAFYVATDKKAFGFCSATCKNVFVLKHRQILSCTNCKVKKYNYDLIQSVTGAIVNFAVCSLNCLPKPSAYILSLKDNMNPLTASEIYSRPSEPPMPIINSVSSLATTTTNHNGIIEDLPIQISSVSSLADVPSIGVERSELTNGETSTALTLRNINDDDIIEIRDEDIISIREPHENGVSDDDDIAEEEVGVVSINDERWINSDISITIGKPPIKMVNKGTSVKTLRITKEVQCVSEELWAMPRVEMKVSPEEKIIYVPVPIPYAVYLPFPVYAFDKPVPMPFPVGIPIPIPIPIDTRFMEKDIVTDTPVVETLPTLPLPIIINDEEEKMDVDSEDKEKS